MRNLSLAAILAFGIGFAVSAQAQTTSDRGVIRTTTSPEQSGPSTMTRQMRELMENCNKMMETCNSMMRSMQQGQMSGHQGTGPTGPRNGN